MFPWATKEYLEQSCRIIEHYWYNVLDNKNVYLNWLSESEWDGGYYKIPQDYFDIFIYDILFMDYYISQGWLSVLDRNQMTYAHEINRNILSLIECNNGKYYGIPIYKCVYLIVYHADDKELASVKTFESLLEITSKRDLIMHNPGRTLKALNYLRLRGSNEKFDSLTEETVNQNIINHLSCLYKSAKVLLDKTDTHKFEKSSFYIGFSEDINTMLLIDENDLSQIEFMYVPINNSQHPQCWLDCIGIHSQTKLRGTYEKSLQLANLMTCSHVMNECLQGQFNVIPTNRVTLSYLASKNTIHSKLQKLISNNIFCPASSLPIITNSSISVHEQWIQSITVIIAQHQKQMQSMINTSIPPS